MHILYFHQHFTTPKGASGMRSYEMARHLVADGHKVTMVCGSLSNGVTGLTGAYHRGRRSGEVDGIHVIEFDLGYSNKDGFVKRSLTFGKFALGSCWLALTQRYDIIFATTTPLTAGIPGIVARWFRRKTFVFEVRDLWPELPKQMGVIQNPLVLALLSMLEWLCYRSAHRCVALAPGIAEGIARRGVDRSRITLVPNGCDIALFQGGQQHEWRPDGVGSGDLMAVFAGTHGQANGLDTVVDAAIILKERGHDDIKIVLIGNGQLKARLQQRAASEKLSNLIFCDPVSKDRLAGLFFSGDVGIQCLADLPGFYFGTSPNKFFDYIASGLPVLCNYPGWVANLIVENKCGFAVPANDPHAFANALVEARQNPDRLVSMGERSLEVAQGKFERSVLARRWINWVLDGSSDEARY
jgi:glycosyltransferase involved in cell wall biosynthesis